MKINPSWAAVGSLAAAGLIQQSKKNAGEWIRIQTAIVYLKTVEILRDLFLYQLGVLICVMFLVFGVILIEGGLVFFLPLQPGERAGLTVILGAVDFLTALGFLFIFVLRSVGCARLKNMIRFSMSLCGKPEACLKRLAGLEEIMGTNIKKRANYETDQ